MRAVHLSDLDVAARVLAGLPAKARDAVANDMVAGAHLADRVRKRTGRGLPGWGSGALQDAARHLGKPLSCDAREPRYRDGLAAILAAIARRGSHHGA